MEGRKVLGKWVNGFKNCKLCEWKCGVNRLEGERGVCGVGMPEVAYTNLAQILQSYSVTMLGCSFKCIYCNAYRLSQYPDSGWFYRGYVDPSELASESIYQINSREGKAMGVNKISFTGGEPTIHLPYIKKVVEEVRAKRPELGVGLATNGFASLAALKEVISLCSYLTFEIKAFNDDTHRAITGAPVEPVLRNAEYLMKSGREKIRAIRTIVIPGINDKEIRAIAEFIASIDASVPLRIIPFRPNYILYYHPGPTKERMDEIGAEVLKTGLEDIWWSGYYPVDMSERVNEIARGLKGNEGAKIAFAYSKLAGCINENRNCGECTRKLNCPAGLKEPWLLDV
jgi:pyruvate formate lyase activating enzyme